MEFYSNGKLLISGEYFVLDGAKCLALPCKKGQLLKIKPNTFNENIYFHLGMYTCPYIISYC